MPTTELGNSLEITGYWHCALCLESKPDGYSPQEWSHIQVGWTAKGLQAWCIRHNVNIVNLDFQGNKVLANATA